MESSTGASTNRPSKSTSSFVNLPLGKIPKDSICERWSIIYYWLLFHSINQATGETDRIREIRRWKPYHQTWACGNGERVIAGLSQVEAGRRVYGAPSMQRNVKGQKSNAK
jgi:hypothetical protein